MTEHGYGEEEITVRTMTESVRRRPGLYFGIGRGNVRLATAVLEAVVGHAFHPATRVAAVHSTHVDVDITGDLAFSVTDDQADVPDGAGGPRLGREGSLLTADRWTSLAVAAVSVRTVVEVWRAGRGFRQTLVGSRAVDPPVGCDASGGAGTRVTFTLDPGFFGSSVLTTDVAAIDVHSRYCTAPPGPGAVLIQDRRRGRGAAAYRFA